MDTDVVVVLVSCPPDRAETLAGEIVEGRFAACVNLIPLRYSVYRWKGSVQRDDETLLLIKTARDRFPALKEFVLKNHPYEVPEVIALPVEAGHAPYLQWVKESTR